MRVAARLLSLAKRLIARDTVEGCPIPARSAIHFSVPDMFFGSIRQTSSRYRSIWYTMKLAV